MPFRFPKAATLLARTAIVIAVVVVVVSVAGCVAPTSPDEDIEAQLLPGERIEGYRAFTGECDRPQDLDLELLASTDADAQAHGPVTHIQLPIGAVFLLDGESLPRFWRRQVEDGLGEPVPSVDWRREAVLLVVLTRSEVSALRPHAVLRGDDGEYHATLVGDTSPLTRADYDYPYCVIVLPVVDRPINVHLVRVGALTQGRFAVERPEALARLMPRPATALGE